MTSITALATLYRPLPLFIFLKIIGGGYLLYVGHNALVKTSQNPDLNFCSKEKSWKLVISGFLLTASNPKDLLFFVGFLPAFINLEEASLPQIITTSYVVVISFFATLSFYALLANQARAWLAKGEHINRLHIVGGYFMIGVGLCVIFL